jgi:hypothetical protein
MLVVEGPEVMANTPPGIQRNRPVIIFTKSPDKHVPDTIRRGKISQKSTIWRNLRMTFLGIPK